MQLLLTRGNDTGYLDCRFRNVFTYVQYFFTGRVHFLRQSCESLLERHDLSPELLILAPELSTLLPDLPEALHPGPLRLQLPVQGVKLPRQVAVTPAGLSDGLGGWRCRTSRWLNIGLGRGLSFSLHGAVLHSALDALLAVGR